MGESTAFFVSISQMSEEGEGTEYTLLLNGGINSIFREHFPDERGNWNIKNPFIVFIFERLSAF